MKSSSTHTSMTHLAELCSSPSKFEIHTSMLDSMVSLEHMNWTTCTQCPLASMMHNMVDLLTPMWKVSDVRWYAMVVIFEVLVFSPILLGCAGIHRNIQNIYSYALNSPLSQLSPADSTLPAILTELLVGSNSSALLYCLTADLSGDPFWEGI